MPHHLAECVVVTLELFRQSRYVVILLEVNMYAVVCCPVVMASMAEHKVWLLPAWMEKRFLFDVDKMREYLV